MTLWSSAGKSNETVSPRSISVVKGTKEKPGIDTIASPSPVMSSGSSSPHAVNDIVITSSTIPRKYFMRILKLAVVMSASIVVFTADVNAQVCLGLPPFGTASIHVNFAAEFPDSAAGYAVGVGGGRDDNAFA